MLLCDNCVPKEMKWLFNLGAAVSFDKCEICQAKAECIEIFTEKYSLGNEEEMTYFSVEPPKKIKLEI